MLHGRDHETGHNVGFQDYMEAEEYRQQIRQDFSWQTSAQIVTLANAATDAIRKAQPGQIAHVDVLQQEIVAWFDKHYPLVRRGTKY